MAGPDVSDPILGAHPEEYFPEWAISFFLMQT
jgi:hypothetical protein